MSSGPFKFWLAVVVCAGGLFVGLHLATEPAGQESVSGVGASDSTPSVPEESASEKEIEQQSPNTAWDRQPSRVPPIVVVSEEPRSESPSSEISASDPLAWRVGSVTVHEAATMIRSRRPALVIFFSTGCSRSREVFPSFVRLADSLGGRYEVLAFATDADGALVDDFLSGNRAGFSAQLLEPWERGELSRAMGGVGLRIGKVWMKPLIAVVGADGRVLGQWEGLTDAGPVGQAVSNRG